MSKSKNSYIRRAKTSKKVRFAFIRFLVCFMVDGIAAYVLPRYDNVLYIKIT